MRRWWGGGGVAGEEVVGSSRWIQFLLVTISLQVMACPFCRAPGGPCSFFDSCASVFTVVLDCRCSRRVVRFYILFIWLWHMVDVVLVGMYSNAFVYMIMMFASIPFFL